MHVPLTDNQARPFKEWYNRPDVMGFEPFKKTKLVPLLKEVLHKQLELLYARQVDYKEKLDLKNKKLLHKSHELLNEQTDRVLGMQYYHREVTGEEYTFEVPCLRANKHCNTRRSAASGMNHTHPLEIMRPSVDYSYYERAVALRQEVRRLGMSAQTGVISSSEERCSILAGRIAEFHSRQAKIMEAKRNQLYTEWRHPKQREDVLDYSKEYINEQLKNAILSSDCERMATLVSRGAPPNYETAIGQTALIKCCQAVNRNAMRKLVKNNSDINYFNKNGMNALMWACKTDNLIMVHEILDNGAAPGTSFTPLFNYANDKTITWAKHLPLYVLHLKVFDSLVVPDPPHPPPPLPYHHALPQDLRAPLDSPLAWSRQGTEIVTRLKSFVTTFCTMMTRNSSRWTAFSTTGPC